jgi:hypothetical protein
MIDSTQVGAVMGDDLAGLSTLIGFYGNVIAFVLFGAVTMTLAQSLDDRWARSALPRKRPLR